MRNFLLLANTILLIYLIKQQNSIIMTQQEAVQALSDLSAKLDKVNTEIQAEIQKLNDALANQGNVTPELQSAVDGLTAKAQALDDLIPDEPV